jgi:hypothetical protein
VLAHEPGERVDVRRIVDARNERLHVGVVERRRQPVDVRRDGGRPGVGEGRDDVHALPRAGEEDRRHGSRA